MMMLGAIACGLVVGYAAVKASEWMDKNFK